MLEKICTQVQTSVGVSKNNNATQPYTDAWGSELDHIVCFHDLWVVDQS